MAPSSVVLLRLAGTSGGTPGPFRSSDEQAAANTRTTGIDQPRIQVSDGGVRIEKQIACQEAGQPNLPRGPTYRRFRGRVYRSGDSPGFPALPFDRRLVVIELQLRQVRQVDREVEREITVRIANEIEGGPPLVQLALEPNDLI